MNGRLGRNYPVRKGNPRSEAIIIIIIIQDITGHKDNVEKSIKDIEQWPGPFIKSLDLRISKYLN